MNEIICHGSWNPPERNCKLPSAELFASANGLTIEEAAEILKPPDMGPIEEFDDLWRMQINCSAYEEKYSRGVRTDLPPEEWEKLRTRKPAYRDAKPITKDKPPYLCPFCMQQMAWRYWSNDTPPLWRCGLWGFIEHCEECKWWCRFQMTGLS